MLRLVRFPNSVRTVYGSKLGKSSTLHPGITKYDLNNSKAYTFMYEYHEHIKMGQFTQDTF